MRHLRDTDGYPPRVVCLGPVFWVSKSLLFLAVFLFTLGGTAQAGTSSVGSAVEFETLTLLASGIALWTLASLLGKAAVNRVNVLVGKRR